ncbi:MAG: cytochrome c family protein [Myxococcales bacterium]|nr:c-type cytochrome [Myxococcales bacterium]
MRFVVAALLVCGCRGSFGEPPYAVVPIGGDPDRGAELIRANRCGACHTIPNVRGAHGVVGPPLTQFALRTFIGGELPNTPQNLIRWIVDPRQIEHATAMPKLGLTEAEARDVAAFLYTLR